MDHLLRGGRQINDDLLDDAAAYGVILPDHLHQEQDYHLWAEHLSALDLFQRCQTQWRATSSGVIGLDYGVVIQMANLYQITALDQVMEELMIMEVHARDLINQDINRR